MLFLFFYVRWAVHHIARRPSSPEETVAERLTQVARAGTILACARHVVP